MSTTAQSPVPPSFLETARATLWIFISLGAATTGMALLYLGMRSVMDIGGACAEGGPFVPVRPCPKGVPLLIFAGIWGALISLGIYVWRTIKDKVPTLLGFAWPALFLSLGWNFLDYGIDPPFGQGLEWGWLVCAVVFGLMGGLPLLFVIRPALRSFFNPAPEPERVKPLPVGELKARLAGVAMPRKAARARSAPAAQPKSAWATLRDLGTTGARTAGPSAAASDDVSSEAEDMVASLERLQYLHRTGSLTDEEFAAAKARIIEGES